MVFFISSLFSFLFMTRNHSKSKSDREKIFSQEFEEQYPCGTNACYATVSFPFLPSPHLMDLLFQTVEYLCLSHGGRCGGRPADPEGQELLRHPAALPPRCHRGGREAGIRHMPCAVYFIIIIYFILLLYFLFIVTDLILRHFTGRRSCI